MLSDLEDRIRANASDETACVLCGSVLATDGRECPHCFSGTTEDAGADSTLLAVNSQVKRARGLVIFSTMLFTWLLAPLAWWISNRALAGFKEQDLAEPWFESRIRTTRVAAGLVAVTSWLALLVALSRNL